MNVWLTWGWLWKVFLFCFVLHATLNVFLLSSRLFSSCFMYRATKKLHYWNESLEYIWTAVVCFLFHRLCSVLFLFFVCVCSVLWVSFLDYWVCVCDIVKVSRDGREAVPISGTAPPRPGAQLLQLIWRRGWYQSSSQTLQRDAHPHRLWAWPQIHLQQPQSPQETLGAASER